MHKHTKLIFDADNTLFDFDRAEETALVKSLEHFKLPKPEGLIDFYRKMNVGLWQQLDNKTITIAQLKQQRAAQLFEFIGQSADPTVFSLHYLDELAKCQFLLDHVEHTLNLLSEHCEMAIITNGLERVQNPRFAASTIKQHFGALVISEALGVAKPDAAIFEHTCDLMQWSDPAAVLMVGDNYRCDIQGAADFGMRTCWYNIRQQAHDYSDHDYEIQRFDELLTVLKA
ncbi:YjjG family noncanonical pyrimidine nucleotidase [Marinicella litoralis]|uniref:2-haloacid dehalogenase/putative hydrolase of the HAD superfamily n=1 Tax=Marinicella litoralis TaxID=644220 RepID=A0A4R6XUH2_9GAMM|nr:YjjG family noncanonical pyrimidine nucleotidase [Marinicella litoralis]TDR23466.1 2-haloacid dehalogenase/putative hydrolase of the HAD superfamily [Marinicella litoralis]